MWSLNSRSVYRYLNSRSKRSLVSELQSKTSGPQRLTYSHYPTPQVSWGTLPIQINHCQQKNLSPVQRTRAQFVSQHLMPLHVDRRDTRLDRQFHTIFWLSWGSGHRLFMVRRENFFSTFWQNNRSYLICNSKSQASIRSSPNLKRNSSLASSLFPLFPSLLNSSLLSALR